MKAKTELIPYGINTQISQRCTKKNLAVKKIEEIPTWEDKYLSFNI